MFNIFKKNKNKNKNTKSTEDIIENLTDLSLEYSDSLTESTLDFEFVIKRLNDTIMLNCSRDLTLIDVNEILVHILLLIDKEYREEIVTAMMQIIDSLEDKVSNDDTERYLQ